VDNGDRSQLELFRVEVGARLDRLTDKVDVLSRDLERFTGDHEKRVRILERWKYAIPASALLVLAAFMGGRVG
jgi:hypothetical protein